MINWIIDNKEWIFGIIGVAVVIIPLIIKIIRKIFAKQEREEQIKITAHGYIEILTGKRSGHIGIPGLMDSGADHLSKNVDLKKVCERIAQHGLQNPLHHWQLQLLGKKLGKKEILNFIKWQATKKPILHTDYANEITFAKLIEKFKKEKS